jgi:hypothetical protein
MDLLIALLARVRTRRIRANETVEFNRELRDCFLSRGEFRVSLVSLASVTRGNSIDLSVINPSNEAIRRLVLRVVLLSGHGNS